MWNIQCDQPFNLNYINYSRVFFCGFTQIYWVTTTKNSSQIANTMKTRYFRRTVYVLLKQTFEIIEFPKPGSRSIKPKTFQRNEITNVYSICASNKVCIHRVSVSFVCEGVLLLRRMRPIKFSVENGKSYTTYFGCGSTSWSSHWVDDTERVSCVDKDVFTAGDFAGGCDMR